MPATQPITVFDDPRLPARFWNKAQPTTDGCWIWMGGDNGVGYGQTRWPTKMRLAHRVAYGVLVGTITGETLDHLCRNRCCVNPAHLEPVTHKENCLRGISIFADNARKTECKRGHALTGYNLIVQKNGNRNCRTCGVERNKGWRAMRRAKESESC